MQGHQSTNMLPAFLFSNKILEVPHTAKSVLIFLPCLAKILLLNDKYTILQLSLNCVAHPHQSVAWQLPFTDGVICAVAHISRTHQRCGSNNDKNQVCCCSVLDHPTALQFSIPIFFHGSFPILSVPQILPTPRDPSLNCCPSLVYPQNYQTMLLPRSSSIHGVAQLLYIISDVNLSCCPLLLVL